MKLMEEWNNFGIIHPLMPLSLLVASPPLMSCFFASHLHPFMSHLSLLTPFSGSEAYVSLDFLLYYLIASYFVSWLSLFFLGIADLSIFTRAGQGLWSFNLLNIVLHSLS